MRTTLLAVAAVTLCACAGNSFDGAVAGVKLDPKSAVFIQQRDSNGAATSAFVAMGDIDNACDEIKANRLPKNGTWVGFTLRRFDSSNKEVAADVGDYTVTDNIFTNSGMLAYSTFNKFDTSCTNTIQSKNANARSGLIKISSYKGTTGGSISGTFDITYGDQADKVTGSINAPFCDAQLSLGMNCE